MWSRASSRQTDEKDAEERPEQQLQQPAGATLSLILSIIIVQFYFTVTAHRPLSSRTKWFVHLQFSFGSVAVRVSGSPFKMTPCRQIYFLRCAQFNSFVGLVTGQYRHSILNRKTIKIQNQLRESAE